MADETKPCLTPTKSSESLVPEVPKRKKTRDSEIFQYEDGSFYFRGYISGKRFEKRLDALTFGEAKQRKRAHSCVYRHTKTQKPNPVFIIAFQLAVVTDKRSHFSIVMRGL